MADLIMKKTPLYLALAAFGIASSFLFSSCEKQTPAEKAADDIGDAVEEVADGVEDAVEEVN